MTELPIHLPRPGLVGVLIRLTLGALVGWMGYAAISDASSFWDGYDDPGNAISFLIPVLVLSSWVVNELFQKSWGQRPAAILVVGLLVAVAVGALQGDPFGPWFGTYLWVWVVVFAALLAPAHLLAAVLRTPGCEMRSFAHLRAKLGGRETEASLCPGWIDRADGIRLFDKW